MFTLIMLMIFIFAMFCFVMAFKTFKNLKPPEGYADYDDDDDDDDYEYTQEERNKGYFEKVLDTVEVEYQNELSSDTKYSKANNYGLPQTVEDLHIYTTREFDVVGSKYSHFGNIGFEGIADLSVGSSVTLKPDPNNPKDNSAIAVLSPSGLYCGWLPAGKPSGTESLFKRMMKGVPVRAIVIRKYIADHDEEWRVKIAVGSYKAQKENLETEKVIETRK